MFNLEQAIAEWRRQMMAAGITGPESLDELEGHLRDDIEQRMRSGSSELDAFESAVQQIGQPTALESEFAKVRATKWPRLQRLKDALLRFLGVPLLSPNAFTAGALEILELGGKEALGFHHDFIGTEHVLLGLLESKTGIVPVVLEKLGVDHKTVRSEIEKIVAIGPALRTGHLLPYTPRVKKALALAGKEARALKQTHIGAEHIFLGLLLEGGGVAALVLKSLGVNIRTAREQILMQLGRNQGGR
jgi:Clp amino terminal domain, pathogenicity island component